MDDGVNKLYGGRIRVRVCALCEDDGRLLMIRHSGLGEDGVFWSPPGGGVHFGEGLEDAVVREVREETGLCVAVEGFLFSYEWVRPPLHAIEFFYRVRCVGGELAVGTDPECEEQIIMEVRYMDWDEINSMPAGQRHAVFSKGCNMDELYALRGVL